MPPFLEALQARAAKTLVPADLPSSVWRSVPAAIRERASFSACTVNAAILQRFDDLANIILNPVSGPRINPVTGTPVTEGLTMGDAQQLIGSFIRSTDYRPPEGKEGTIEDLSSDARIKLKLETDTQQAQGYGQFMQSQRSIEAFPCQELYRIEDRREKRDWRARWTMAAQIAGDPRAVASLVQNRMVARKDSPIWEALGNVADDSLGTPYPPFAFRSGMWVKNVGRAEAVALGVIDPDTVVQAQTRGLNDTLQMDPATMSQSLTDALLSSLGPSYTRDAEGIIRRSA